MLTVSYDNAGSPTVAVGTGSPSLDEPQQWVRQHREPLLFCEREFVLITLNAQGSPVLEPFTHETSLARALTRARRLLTDQDPEHTEPKRRPQREADFEAGG